MKNVPETILNWFSDNWFRKGGIRVLKKKKTKNSENCEGHITNTIAPPIIYKFGWPNVGKGFTPLIFWTSDPDSDFWVKGSNIPLSSPCFCQARQGEIITSQSNMFPLYYTTTFLRLGLISSFLKNLLVCRLDR